MPSPPQRAPDVPALRRSGRPASPWRLAAAPWPWSVDNIEKCAHHTARPLAHLNCFGGCHGLLWARASEMTARPPPLEPHLGPGLHCQQQRGTRLVQRSLFAPARGPLFTRHRDHRSRRAQRVSATRRRGSSRCGQRGQRHCGPRFVLLSGSRLWRQRRLWAADKAVNGLLPRTRNPLHTLAETAAMVAAPRQTTPARRHTHTHALTLGFSAASTLRGDAGGCGSGGLAGNLGALAAGVAAGVAGVPPTLSRCCSTAQREGTNGETCSTHLEQPLRWLSSAHASSPSSLPSPWISRATVTNRSPCPPPPSAWARTTCSSSCDAGLQSTRAYASTRAHLESRRQPPRRGRSAHALQLLRASPVRPHPPKPASAVPASPTSAPPWPP